jgi:hypothetical protein
MSFTYTLTDSPIIFKHLETAKNNGEFAGFKAQVCDQHLSSYEMDDEKIQSPFSCECMVEGCKSKAFSYFWIDTDFLEGFNEGNQIYD